MATKQTKSMPSRPWNGLGGYSPAYEGPKNPPKGGSALPSTSPRTPATKK